ncbi:MAG: permease [Planctomycetota bacterium]
MDYEQLILIFTAIIYEALPFVVLGVVLAGILEEFVPQQALVKVIPSNPYLAVALGAVLGLAFPMCECGIVVVMRRLLRKGLPLGVCVSYMLAGPIINVVVMLSTYAAFNTPDRAMSIFGGPINVVLLRVGFAFIIAVNTGLIVGRLQKKVGIANLLAPIVMRGLDDNLQKIDEDTTTPRSWSRSLNNISMTALTDFIDIMAFLIIGASLAAVGRLALQQGDSQNIINIIQGQPAIAILAMMGIAVLFCLCSEADAFVAANFAPYWPPASKLAFLVLGPMFDLKLYIMYTRVFRPKLIFTIIGCVVVQVFVLSMAAHYFEPQISKFDLRRPVSETTSR